MTATLPSSPRHAADVLVTAPVAVPSTSVRRPGPGDDAPPGRAHALIGRLAGVAIPAGGVLMLLSTVFDPRSPEPEPRGMFVAYGADRAGADIAATILHYGFATFGIGLMLAALAMASRRGRGVALAGGLLGMIGFVNMSGAVLSDWYDASLASTFGPDKAMALSQAASDMPALTAGWMVPGFVGSALGPIVLAVGLARGRIVSWWTLALPMAMIACLAVPVLGSAGFLVALGLGIAFGVVVALGLRRRAVGD